MKFAIRDDDTSFFTNPEELEQAYDFIKEGCISLSIVPYTVPSHKSDVFTYGKDIKYDYYDIAENKELILYLQDKISKGRYSPLLHGYSHEYKLVKRKWVAEMLWKDQARLQDELEKGKKHLEKLLNCEIFSFAAPNNSIDSKAIKTIEKLNMNYSGTISLNKIERSIDIYYIKNYLHRFFYRCKYKQAYGGVYKYKGHNEEIAYDLLNYNRLIEEYNMCKEHNVPFVVFTHYWHLLCVPEQKDLLKRLYEYMKNDGAELVSVTKLLKTEN